MVVVTRDVLAYLAATLTALWGIAHVAPTKQVVAGFEPITVGNRRVLIQEWLAEAVTMWGLAAVVIVVTAVAAGGSVTTLAYRVIAAVLLVLALLTALTGARTSVIWFKVCPVLLTVAACLLLAASLVGG